MSHSVGQITYKPRILVHIHVFYPKLLNGYLEKLKAVENLADLHLVATISDSISDNNYVRDCIIEAFEDARIIPVPNVGYDLAPFIEVINGANLDEYDFVLKLHTKSRGKKILTWLNDIRVSDDIWVDMLVDGLLGSEKKFLDAIHLLCEDGVGLVASERCITRDRAARRDYYRYRINDELESIGLSSIDDLYFVAGTMFMAWAGLLKPLQAYRLDDFGKCISGVSDYTLAHTFERFLSAVVLSQGFELRGLKSKTYETKRELAVFIQRGRDQSAPPRKPIHKAIPDFSRRAKRRLRFELMGKQIIAKSAYFDADWYSENNPDIGSVDPATHYLRLGYKEGRNPSRFFDNELYYEENPDIREKGFNPLLHFECYGTGGKRRTGMPGTQESVALQMIRNSDLFDADWYLANSLDAKGSGKDPAVHYLKGGGFVGRDPSPNFCSAEYLALHPDVKSARINPLLHYLTEGMIQGHEVSSLEIKEHEFPEKAVTCERLFARKPVSNRRTAIVAAYTGDGVLPDTLLYLLRGLLEVVDNIVLIGDCPLYPEELDKLEGLVAYARFERVGQYDFGSYKRGLRKVRDLNLLDESEVDELIIMNDSCYGPVYPFSESFEIMKNYRWDFWGFTSNKSNEWYLCSYFIVFNRKIIDSKIVDEFFCRVQGTFDRGTAIDQFEVGLSTVLRSQGMVGASLVGWNDLSRNNHRRILTGLKQYRVPLLKKKSLAGEALENIQACFEIVKRDNPELYELMDKRIGFRRHSLPTLEDYRRSIPEILGRLRQKISNKQALKVVFLVNDSAMFPGKALMDCMIDDESFDPYIAVIPDTRWPESVDEAMARCEMELDACYASDRFIRVRHDRYDRWPDVLHDADIVCYPSPYNVSEYNYNVRFVLGRQFLPIIFNYGYYRSIYDREILGLFNYAYFWKVFLECDDNLDEYCKYSVSGGGNAALVGYAKMDALSKVARHEHDRPRILVALHHSVDGGYNDTLALANFVRYYDYFRKLPDKYSAIDFVYRPHPALLKALKSAAGWEDSQVDAYLREMKSKPNVIWSDGGDYFQEFADSDACIQDCGSFLVEYFYTGKPCCYMLKDPSDIEEKFAPLGKACLEHCYVSYDTEAIDSFINNVVLAGDDPKADGRAKLANHIMLNYPHAADAALRDIKESIMGCADDEGRSER